MKLQCFPWMLFGTLGLFPTFAKSAPILVMDRGVSCEQLNNSQASFSLPLDLEALFRFSVPGDAGPDFPQQTLADSNLSGFMSLIEATKLRTEWITHLQLVVAAMTISPAPAFPFLPVVEPARQLASQRALNPVNAGIEYAVSFLKAYFDSLSRIIREANIRTLVRTISVPRESLVGTLCWQYRGDPVMQERCVTKIVDLYSRGFEKLFRDNPQTAFVIAAGNTGKQMAEEDDLDFAALKQANVLVVAALAEGALQLADYSSWHPQLVRLATFGTLNYVSPNDSKLEKQVEGTSYSAPRVAAYVDREMLENPELTGAEAIDRLIRTHSIVEPSLLGTIHEGRIITRSAVGCRSLLSGA